MNPFAPVGRAGYWIGYKIGFAIGVTINLLRGER